MSQDNLGEFVTAVSHILTPANQNPPQAAIQITTMSVGEGISNEIVQKNHLPQDTGANVGHLLTLACLNSAVCFGYPKKQYSDVTKEQAVFSSSTMVQYYKSIDIFLSIIPSFLTNYLNITMEVIQHKKTNDDFKKTVDDFVEYFQFLNFLCSAADIEQRLLPSEFGAPKLKDQIDSLSQKILKCLQEGDQFRAMKEVNQPADQQESIFAREIQELNDQVSKYRQLFSSLQNKITDNFDTLFVEQPYVEWELYCKNITNDIFSIFIISYEIAKYDPSQFLNLIRILDQLCYYTFLMHSHLTRLIRFRGNFEEYVSKSKEAHEKLGTIFAPLLQAIINILPKCPQPFTEFSKIKITSLFTEIQRLHNEYNSRAEKLIAALKSDRRYSSFAKNSLGCSNNPEIDEGIKGTLDALLKIATLLLRQKFPPNEINEACNKFAEEYSKFNKLFTDSINKASDFNDKTRYIQQRDAYANAVNRYMSGLQMFLQNPTNNILRTQAGIYATNLLLALCNLDPSQAIIKTLGSLYPVVGENIAQFLPGNTKTLIDLLTLIDSKKSELPQPACEAFLALHPTTISTIREASTVYSANPDPNNPQNIGNCLHENDKLHPLLSCMNRSLNVQGLPTDLQAANQLVSIFAFNIKGSSDIFRITFQTYATALLKSYSSQIIPFTEFFSNYTAKIGEQYHLEYMKLKDDITSRVNQLKNDLKNEPPIGVFDFYYLKLVKASYQNSMIPTLGAIKRSIEIQKTFNPPVVVKQVSDSINNVCKILAHLMKFVDELEEFRNLPNPSIIGPLLEAANEATTNDIAKLAGGLQSDPSQASLLANNLVNSLNDLSQIMSYNDVLKEISKQMAPIIRGIAPASAHISLGMKDEIPQLSALLQQIVNNLLSAIQPIQQAYKDQLQGLGKQKADELAKPPEQPQDPNVPLFPKGPGHLVDPKTGQKYPGLLIDQIPDSSMIDKLFMNAMQSPNDQMKNLLTNYVDQIKKDVDEFLPLFAEYQRNPTPELLAKLNALGSRILANLKAYQDALNFNPEAATEDHLKELLNNFQDLPSALKALSAPELLLNALACANSKLKDPQQIALINAAIGEILKSLTENPELAYKQLELLTKSLLAEDPSTVLEDCLKETRKTLNDRDASSTAINTEGIVFADRLLKILSGQPFSIEEGSIHSKLLVTSQKIQDEDKITEETFESLNDLLNTFEEMVEGMDETEKVNENEIADKVMDLNNEVMELGVAIQNDLKKSPPDQAELEKKLDEIKSKSLEVAGLTSLVASKRQDLDKDTNEQLQDETSKIFDTLKSLEDAINSCKGASNARNAQRQVQKANRELQSSLGGLSDLIETIIEQPPSSLEPSDKDYNSYGNMLQNQIVKLAKLLQSCGNDRSSSKFKNGVKKIMKPLNESLQKFRNSTGNAVKGAEEESAIMKQIGELENLLNTNLSNPEKIDPNCPQEGYQLISDIRHAIDEALNTEVVAQPKAVSSLPFRYTVPQANQNAAPASTQELLPHIEAAAKKIQDNLQSFTTVLNNAKSSADSITGSLSSFHDSVSKLIEPLDRMIASTWNPQSQNQLTQARQALIASADYSIDTTRNRLLGSEGWRDDISMFNGSANDSIDQVLQAARKAFELAKADLSVTNEAERELVKAAQSVSESQKRLASMKSVAQEKKITHGEGYLGLDIIDISAPILSTAAKLIETAQAQTKFLLKRDPNLPNTKGLVKTAQDLVESLTLITVAAECTVNNEPDCISKVLAASNLVSSSAAHFLAEVYQKNGSPDLNAAMESITGSIQGLVKQLRAFGEAAQRQQSEKNAASAVPSAQKLSSMIQKLNAEAKVVEARRALEEAELKLKKTRLENK